MLSKTPLVADFFINNYSLILGMFANMVLSLCCMYIVLYMHMYIKYFYNIFRGTPIRIFLKRTMSEIQCYCIKRVNITDFYLVFTRNKNSVGLHCSGLEISGCNLPPPHTNQS